MSHLETWWEAYRAAHPDMVNGYDESHDFPRYDQLCSDMYYIAHSGVPGLLQTEQYARSIVHEMHPRYADRHEAVPLRMLRQHHFFERPNPPKIHAVIDESILHRRFSAASDSALHEQLMHLCDMNSLPHISIHIYPLFLPIPWVFLRSEVITIIYKLNEPKGALKLLEEKFEGLHGNHELDSFIAIETLAEFELLRGRCLNKQQSTQHMRKLAHALQTHQPLPLIARPQQ